MKKTLAFLLSLTILSSTFAQLPQKGLIFNFPFNGNINDVGPNKNTGNIITSGAGGITLDADRNNNPASSYFFSGGHLNFGNTDLMSVGDSSFTFSAWYCQTSYKDVATIYSNNYGFAWGMSIGVRNGSVYVAVCGGTMPNSISINVLDDANYKWYDWHHVAVVLDRTTKKCCVYVDGVKKNIANDTSYGPYGGTISGNELDFTGLPLNLTSSGTTAIGAYYVNYKMYQNFVGLLDDIALYNRALSVGEITGIYSGTVSLHESYSHPFYHVSLNLTGEELFVQGVGKTAELTIFDLNGVKIASSNANAIQVSNLSKGLYILRVKEGANVFTEKFSKN